MIDYRAGNAGMYERIDSQYEIQTMNEVKKIFNFNFSSVSSILKL